MLCLKIDKKNWWEFFLSTFFGLASFCHLFLQLYNGCILKVILRHILAILFRTFSFTFFNNVISFIQMLATINSPKVQAPFGFSLLHPGLKSELH